jgi:alginate O-acetyltransferase complex protein AlgI
MDLLSLPYAFFVLITVFLFQICPARFKPSLLVAFSVGIYAYNSPVSAGILVAAALMVFGAARALDQSQIPSTRRRLFLASAIIPLLAYLLFIKLIPIFHERGHAPSAERIFIALGVSYYTFKLMGYLIDVYWRKYPAWGDPLSFLAFVSFFPQLSAGPIQRAHEFELPKNGDKTAELMVTGLRRILLGVVKKTALADQLGSMIAYINGMQPQYSNLLWIAACLFTLELYFDFSALTDIAIGTAAMFGIKSPENFAHPFFAPSISQFWRRWHMTLTFWLTDYIFTPLRMATRNWGNLGLVFSITVNMTLIGLWHGLNVGFLIFGLVHSGYLVVDSLTASERKRYYRQHPRMDAFTNLIGPVFVFCLVSFSLIFFRAETWPRISYQMQNLWGGLRSPVDSVQKLFYGFSRLRFGLIGLAVVAFEINEYLQATQNKGPRRIPEFSSWPLPVRWAIYYAAIALVFTLHQQSVHFIYVQF